MWIPFGIISKNTHKKIEEKKIIWCLRQQKGIKIVKPNNYLSNIYLEKSNNSLNVMNAALKIKEYDWVATTAYYARYFSIILYFVK